MFLKIIFRGADSFNPQCLTVRDCCLAMLWVATTGMKILMGISALGVKICRENAISQGDCSVQERNSCVRPFGRKFNSEMCSIQIINKMFEWCLTMDPDGKYIINIAEIKKIIFFSLPRLSQQCGSIFPMCVG